MSTKGSSIAGLDEADTTRGCKIALVHRPRPGPYLSSLQEEISASDSDQSMLLFNLFW